MKTWKVFPVTGKRPALEGDWRAHATDDPAQIKEWRAIGYGLGLACELSGVVVIDPDADKADSSLETGFNELRALGEIAPTYWVRTPGGGRHYYFDDCGQPVSGRDLAPHVNVRSRGGYVVIYDALIIKRLADGGGGFLPYCAPLPEWVRHKLQEQAETRAQAAESVDLGANIRRAVLMLEDAAVAIEGAGGDNRTYAVINQVLDLVPTDDVETIAAAMDSWNARCQPPWDEDELAAKIGNALTYRQNEAGAWGVAAPDARFCGGSGDDPGP